MDDHDLHSLHVALRCMRLELLDDRAAVEAEIAAVGDQQDVIFGMMYVVTTCFTLIEQVRPELAGARTSMLLDQVGRISKSEAFPSMVKDQAEAERITRWVVDVCANKRQGVDIFDQFDHDFDRAWRGVYLVVTATVLMVSEIFGMSDLEVIEKLITTIPPDPGPAFDPT